ncbi:hypothetical protein M426DRAFT_96113 [Hypoxylon sp. CI-4A]|nr:hypothetical protein M426DRAFT_96113 [Hypoxylon sp. CI-4A]
MVQLNDSEMLFLDCFKDVGVYLSRESGVQDIENARPGRYQTRIDMRATSQPLSPRTPRVLGPKQPTKTYRHTHATYILVLEYRMPGMNSFIRDTDEASFVFRTKDSHLQLSSHSSKGPHYSLWTYSKGAVLCSISLGDAAFVLIRKISMPRYNGTVGLEADRFLLTRI